MVYRLDTIHGASCVLFPNNTFASLKYAIALVHLLKYIQSRFCCVKLSRIIKKLISERELSGGLVNNEHLFDIPFLFGHCPFLKRHKTSRSFCKCSQKTCCGSSLTYVVNKRARMSGT